MNPHWIPATWHMKSRNVRGRVRRDEYEDPIRTKRGLVVGFMTWEEISLDELPKDAFVIMGADVEYVADGDILSVLAEQVKKRDNEEQCSPFVQSPKTKKGGD